MLELSDGVGELLHHPVLVLQDIAELLLHQMMPFLQPLDLLDVVHSLLLQLGLVFLFHFDQHLRRMVLVLEQLVLIGLFRFGCCFVGLILVKEFGVFGVWDCLGSAHDKFKLYQTIMN